MKTDRWMLFAPGAGAPSSSPWMTGWAQRLESIAPVITFDYPYQAQGRKRPDPLPVLLQHHEERLRLGVERFGGRGILVGKSMGSRVSCHLAALHSVEAVICFGYPLQNARGVLRTEALLGARCPLLLLQGTRDSLCPLDELRSLLTQREAPTSLEIVESGDHSLVPTQTHLKQTGLSRAAYDLRIFERISQFLAALPEPT